ncbi:uncharacterized protein LOC129115997 [Anoplopoma fimbria]|uniref:uncharacterized protein LOC129115997 n=1 Tax=Anoplopoma fimbria TaxID=229290 RepID=UPI0023ED09A5|nr:uncharacterized protein LOC129115997 [Anoplopoma fimbria]
MIFWILLLFILTSSFSGSFAVNVTQSSYQAEENHNITLEWTFTTNTQLSLNYFSTLCQLITDVRQSVLFHIHDGVEVPESQDEQFAGRVQWDKDVLREGRLRLHVSRLRTADSGLYQCDVFTRDGPNSRQCHLNVTGSMADGLAKRWRAGSSSNQRMAVGKSRNLSNCQAQKLAEDQQLQNLQSASQNLLTHPVTDRLSIQSLQSSTPSMS